jgi:hypothetical protein
LRFEQLVTSRPLSAPFLKFPSQYAKTCMA